MSFYDTQKELWKDWTYSHPKILHALILSLKPEIVMEIGCYRAFSTCWMAKALQENNKGRLYSVDNWSLKEHVERYGDPRAHAVANMEACGVREWIEILDGESDKVKWPDKVDFCYIDGWHSYKSVEFEFNEAAKRGASVIALDDTENCVGPRMFEEWVGKVSKEDAQFTKDGNPSWQRLHIHGDNGLTLFIKNQEKRLITFSQELPDNPGVDLRPLTLAQQAGHFAEAAAITGLDYFPLIGSTEHV